MSAVPRPSRPGEDPHPDEALVREAMAGDADALDELLARSRRNALRWAARIVGKDEAEDIVQEAFLLACRFIGSLHEPSKFENWLFSIVRFRAFRLGRKEARRRVGRIEFDDDVVTAISLFAFSRRLPEEEDAELVEALSRMPLPYGEVLRHHFLDGHSHQRIAEMSGASLSAVKYRCARGKELLREILGEMRTPLPRRVESACRSCSRAGDRHHRPGGPPEAVWSS